MFSRKDLKMGALAIAGLMSVQLGVSQTSTGKVAAGPESAQGATVATPRLNDTISGEWTAGLKKGSADQVEVMFLHRSPKYGLRMEFETIPAADLRGSGASGAVDLRIARESDTFRLQGHFNNGRGSGDWSLSPNPDFLSGMRSRGYSDLSAEDMYSAAIADLRLQLIDDLKSEGYTGLTFHELFEAAAFGITPDFIRGVKADRQIQPPFEKLVEIRIKSKNK